MKGVASSELSAAARQLVAGLAAAVFAAEAWSQEAAVEAQVEAVEGNSESVEGIVEAVAIEVVVVADRCWSEFDIATNCPEFEPEIMKVSFSQALFNFPTLMLQI